MSHLLKLPGCSCRDVIGYSPYRLLTLFDLNQLKCPNKQISSRLNEALFFFLSRRAFSMFPPRFGVEHQRKIPLLIFYHRSVLITHQDSKHLTIRLIFFSLPMTL